MANFPKDSIGILEARYLMKNKDGVVIETPNQMLERVSVAVAEAEKTPELKTKWIGEFLGILDTLEFLPNSPTLMNAGKDLGQLSACFLIEVQDDLAAILESVKRSALIHKTGGGTGIVFSKIRPANSLVGSTFGVASGPVSFMKIFDASTSVIKQGGVRRGANLGALKASHPDIFEFVNCKRDNKSFSNFNISVVASDKFMRAVEEDKNFDLTFSGRLYKTIKAKELFEEICTSAWISGDPGMIFIDEANRGNPTPWLGKFEGTNPCGEQPLLPYESCNLGSIDVSKFYKNNSIDYSRLKKVIEVSVRFLDDVITVNKFPNAKIRHKTLLTRKIGLGIMGYADLLLQMGIRYDSEVALKVARDIMNFIQLIAKSESINIGKEKGVIDRIKIKQRNSTLTTIAPTGTLSILAGCSSGIEPIFGREVSKLVMDGKMVDIASKGKDSDFLVTAHEVTPEWHIKTQSAFQEFTDNAVSKTVNLPENTPEEDIEKLYMLAWKLKCKGITVFRDKCKPGVLITANPEGLGPNGEIRECTGDRCLI